VPFSDDPVEFIQAALQPARVREVRLDDETGTATVVVSDYQLSLAIGKEGQNARLSARLSGWRVDIKSETQLAEEESRYGEEWAEGEWVENEAGEMVWQPAEGGEAVSATEWSRVVAGDEDDAASGPDAPKASSAAESPLSSAPATGPSSAPATGPSSGPAPAEASAGQSAPVEVGTIEATPTESGSGGPDRGSEAASEEGSA